VIGFQVVGRDISERKRDELALHAALEELKELEEKFHTMIDFTRDMELWYSGRGSLIYVTPSCANITGYSQEEFTLQLIHLENLIVPEDAERYQEIMRRMHDEGNIIDDELRIRTKNGKMVWLGICFGRVVAKRGKYHGVRLSVRDITEKKDS